MDITMKSAAQDVDAEQTNPGAGEEMHASSIDEDLAQVAALQRKVAAIVKYQGYHDLEDLIARARDAIRVLQETISTSDDISATSSAALPSFTDRELLALCLRHNGAPMN